MAQVTDTQPGRLSNAIDQPVKRHKWEININLIPLFKLQSPDNWAYPYLIKLNTINKGNKPGAVRFMATPYYLRENESFYGGNANLYLNPVRSYFRPTVVLGYEWQKIKGRFVFFYGADMSWRAEINNFHDNKAKKKDENGIDVTGTLRTKTVKNAVTLSPFMGAKYYLNHRFSISLESQLRLLYSKKVETITFNGSQISKEVLKEPQIATFGYFVLNFSYNL
ncbi:hypothetical protein [Emticicia sp. 21SJ11W-3]|uniref:hypothetical protein n=1 Tax=Emticicia sp. 21SJ11W-3 TaxID=2916755 RepID=UPI0020A151A3|nr:hypothetical protein [Emticicia sp. 21SJ11W-3]UTA66583.1 hypothetical protein MB380_13330 [Emticicia sp. 21SJ11W-3]